MRIRSYFTYVAALALIACAVAVSAQRRDAFVASRDHAAIRYSDGPTANAITALNQRLEAGTETLAFNDANGYLSAVLNALKIPVESQALVFSQTSFQGALINMHNPRAVFFNDSVAVGWVRGGDILELSALDPRQGTVFYSLEQTKSGAPRFKRDNQCLACHLSWDTVGVPGMLLGSMYPLPDDPNAYASGYTTVQGSPLEQRWGGWWVTGDHGGAQHMGNVPILSRDNKFKLPKPTAPLKSVEGLFDLKGYPTPHSDVVAQLVLAHQVRMSNLITRTGWEARLAEAQPSADAAARVREAAADLVDYLLFVDEEPLKRPVRGTSGFTERFAASGPRDPQGRSFREFDLQRRLFKYPCSYMIYSEAFDALPPAAKTAVYDRMLTVLSGRDSAPRYKVLSAADRRAVLEILRTTKKDLPAAMRQ
jgi:hypothetical protein